jgi:hypothetical protein
MNLSPFELPSGRSPLARVAMPGQQLRGPRSGNSSPARFWTISNGPTSSRWLCWNFPASTASRLDAIRFLVLGTFRTQESTEALRGWLLTKAVASSRAAALESRSSRRILQQRCSHWTDRPTVLARFFGKGSRKAILSSWRSTLRGAVDAGPALAGLPPGDGAGRRSDERAASSGRVRLPCRCRES